MLYMGYIENRGWYVVFVKVLPWSRQVLNMIRQRVAVMDMRKLKAFIYGTKGLAYRWERGWSDRSEDFCHK